jgi:hypothetical protein
MIISIATATFLIEIGFIFYFLPRIADVTNKNPQYITQLVELSRADKPIKNKEVKAKIKYNI